MSHSLHLSHQQALAPPDFVRKPVPGRPSFAEFTGSIGAASHEAFPSSARAVLWGLCEVLGPSGLSGVGEAQTWLGLGKLRADSG